MDDCPWPKKENPKSPALRTNKNGSGFIVTARCYDIFWGTCQSNEGGEHSDSAELIDNVLPLLLKHKVQVWLNGHDHDLQDLSAGDLHDLKTVNQWLD
jgi:hypothetical protein